MRPSIIFLSSSSNNLSKASWRRLLVMDCGGMVCKPKRISMTVMAEIGVIKVGRLRARRTVDGGGWGGDLVAEVADCSVCDSILDHGPCRKYTRFSRLADQVC